MYKKNAISITTHRHPFLLACLSSQYMYKIENGQLIFWQDLLKERGNIILGGWDFHGWLIHLRAFGNFTS